MKLRGLPHGVHSRECVARRAIRVAVGADRPDPQVVVDVVGHATGSQIRRGSSMGVACLDVEGADTPRPFSPECLEPGGNGNDPVVEEADAAGVEGDEVLLQIQTKVEEVRAVGEEGPLLRKEEGKAREVDLPAVGLDLGEVGVDRDNAIELGCHVVTDIDARLALGEAVVRDVVVLELAQGVGRHRQAPALGKRRDPFEVPGPPHVEEVCIQRRPGPAEGHELPRDVPLDVEAPLPAGSVEPE